MSAYGAELKVDIDEYARIKNATIVDLRSDTVTKPSAAMKSAMVNAALGDDVFGEDPTVNALERKAAKMVGKEAALFVTSGTMGNLIAMMVHCDERGCEVYCGENSHTVLHEQGGAAQIAGVTICTIPSNVDGSFCLTKLRSKFRKDRLHEPTSRLVVVENTFNGVCVGQDWLVELATVAAQRDLKLHMDGARLWNATIRSGIPAERIVRDFDSVTFCLSKGLGAPIGSMLCGSRDFVARARRVRKVLGGGTRQAGVIAAAGIVALDETLPLLEKDHARARKLEKVFTNRYEDTFQPLPRDVLTTNVVILDVRQQCDYDARTFATGLTSVGDDDPDEPRVIVRALALTDKKIRFVLHRDITDDALDDAISKIEYVLRCRETRKV